MSSELADLTVAVTGPTGTFGAGLIPLLDADDRIAKVVGIARSPFDPASRGWTKLEYRQGDVRDPAALQRAFEAADVVVHLAFLIVGGKPEVARAINIEGTLNAFRAAAAAGVKRFVYSSSVAVYGFHRDNPVGMTEDQPIRPSARWAYSQEKAELEQLLQHEAAEHPDLATYILRAPAVLGPNAVGRKKMVPDWVASATRPIADWFRRTRPRLLVPAPDIPLQIIHEADVGSALRQCVVAAGPPGTYNIAAADTPTVVEIVDAFGLRPISLPARPTYAIARLLVRLPLPSAGRWVELMSHPSVMDTTKVRSHLDWQPQHSALDTIRSMRRHGAADAD